MAQTIKLKRTATPSNVPTTAQLELGEVAINTYDGNVYIKKNDGADAIVKINANPSDLNYFINGTGTVAGTWLGTDPDITSYYDGLVIWYRITINGAATTTLNVNGLGAKTIYRYSTAKLTTHWPVGSVIPLVYVAALNGGSFIGGYDWSDGTESYTVRWNQVAKNGASIIHGYQLLMQGADNLMYPVTVGGAASSTTNVVQTAELRMGGQMLYYNSATDIAANGNISGSILYEGITSAEMEYWSNRNNSTPWATAYLPMYLVGTVNANGNIILDNSTTTAFLTQTLPTTDNGKVYIQIGWMGNTTDNWRLSTHHPVFEFKGGSLRLYQKDGAGSGLDADLLDGQQGSYYYPASNPNGYTNDQTAAEILTAIKTVDGASSGLDADLLDGQQGSYYATAASVAAVAALDPVITLTGAVTGTGTMTNLGNVSIATTATSDPVITLTGAVTGSGTMTNLGNVSITTTNTADPVLTLTGDVTGSATFTNLGNATLTAVVANDSHEHSIYAPIKRGSATISNAGWTTVCTVDGDALGSSVRMTVAGTGASTVISSILDIVCNHHLDIMVTSQTSTYTTLYVKIVSDNNEDFAVQLKTNSANSLPVNIEVFPLNNETVTFTSTNPYTGATLEHECMNGGFASSSSGGAAHGFYSNGSVLATAASVAAIAALDPVITLTGAVTGSGTMTNLGNVSIATTATADPVLTLTGDVTGSATFTNLGNATLTAVVADDSHNHIISNVDGLQTALDSKLNLSGGTMTGALTIGSTGLAATPVVRINNSSAATFVHSLEALSPNLTANQTNILVVGEGASTKNSGYIGYNWAAAGSNSNYVTIGHWAADHLVKVYGDGATAIAGTVSAPTFNATSTTNGGFQGIDADTITAPSFTWTSDLDTGMWHSAADAIGFTTGGVNRVTITSTGITAVGDVTAYSDIRLKDNIEVIPNAVSKVQQLRGVTFTRNDVENLEQRHTGVIAQEVEAVLPEAVSEDNAGIKNVAYGNMVGLLIEAIKELKSEVDDLKQQMENK